ncbi:MAG: transpeptidase family protein [Treponema sp.]|jgi:cell division protein FtsI (penicillin-binding protein 3)|nr:transpeptidase family protein [Treponema sp.]
MSVLPKRRFIIFISLLLLATLIIIIRYATLMLGGSPPGQPQSKAFTERGPILDRNGRFLALQTKFANISVWRPEIAGTEALAKELAPILEMPQNEILEKITGSSSDFIYLKKQVAESTTKLIEAARSEGKLRGVSVEPIVGRVYPEKKLASQIIGFVGDENDGLGGIEYAFDQELSGSGTNGKGSHIALTIDANVQYILEQIAEASMKENQAEAVMLMAMDPRSGDILGSASLPGFDPNDIRSSSELGRMDRPAIWAYEPGSVFKVFSLSALMDWGAISGNTVFVCNGYYEHVTNRGERVQINCLAAHGRVSAREIIIYSCNAGAAYASDRLTNTALYDLLRNYGFGSRTGVGNPGETAGFLRPADRWSDRSKATIAMGQEISVSAIQMIQAASVIANDGILVPPKIVSRIISADGKIVIPWENSPNRRVLKPETARAMRSYMVDVTSDIGTGWRANVEDLSLAVKTGTAQIIDPVTRSYSNTDFIASCIALLPAESPSLILYMAIIKPRGEILGGRIAAPAIREAAESLINYLGIPRGRNPQVNHSASIALPADTTPRIGDRVPSFYGLAKRTILPLLLRDDIRIEIRGEGWVQRQSPPPGTPVTGETVIVLELE